MGRKRAPQPLALSDAGATPGDGTGSRQTIRQVHSPTTAASSPTSSLRTPRSPLSPFRLGPKKSPRGKDRQDISGTDDARKPRELRNSSPASSPIKSEVPIRSPSQTQNQDPQYRPHLGRGAEATSPYLPLAATLHQASLGSPTGHGPGMMPRGAESPTMRQYTGMDILFWS